MSGEPFLNGGNGNGRDSRGRFAGLPGPGAPPNKLRARLNKAIKAKDIDKAVAVLRAAMDDALARPGERIAAAREMLDRGAGKPATFAELEILQRIEALERLVLERQAVNGN
jgi:hypothetical protein